MTLRRAYHSIRLLLIRSESGRAEYLKKKHVLGGVGVGCRWGPWLVPLYPELIILHDNVCVHKSAHIVVHDMMNNFLQRCAPKADFGSIEVLGPVEIHDNVYISMNATVMPNVEIGKNCIISAGAVVTGDIAENSIVAGNPAKVVGRFDAYLALRHINASKNRIFQNQHLPADVAEYAWDAFRKKHNRTNIERDMSCNS